MQTHEPIFSQMFMRNRKIRSLHRIRFLTVNA